MAVFPGDSDEQARLADCSQEPIRTPGSVQAHGALIAIDSQSSRVSAASENSEAIVGISAADMLGMPLVELIGAEAARSVGALAVDDGIEIVPVSIGPQPFIALVHRTAEAVILEVEPTLAYSDDRSVSAVFKAIRRLAGEATEVGLRSAVAREISRITGYDRVMVYHFHPDGHGEVVAEVAASGMEPYLGLHFPASDIPLQARQLYVSKLSRLIHSTESPESPLIAMEGTEVRPAIDLSGAELRSVSPLHLQFMRNMGQASTLSLSIVQNGVLTGMVTCAHRTPRFVPFVLRQALEILAGHAAVQLESMQQAERLTEQLRSSAIRGQLLAQLSATGDIGAGVLDGPATVLDLVPAAGAILRHRGSVRTIGDIADADAAVAAVDALRAAHPDGVIETTSLPATLPSHAAALLPMAGVLVVPLGDDGDFLAWLRPEITDTVDWLGDQGPLNRVSPLSPRNSFSSWSRSASGVSTPWERSGEAAADLSRDVQGLLERWVESELASMAMLDSLTGLPNRRALMVRLDQALARCTPGGSIAALFVDLDRFKEVNDTFGHDAGDSVLAHVAQQIRSAIRTQDTVGRIGGDEFIVICEDIDVSEAAAVARRIDAAIRTPVVTGSRTLHITASIGTASVRPPITASALLNLADADMYESKRRRHARAGEESEGATLHSS
jgi:diguanylate cyclase (GGDEF)-like protein